MVQEYRSADALNYSLIKRIIGASDISEEDELTIIPGERKHITLGQCVDLILSYGEDTIYDNIQLYEEGNEPSSTIVKILYNAFEEDNALSNDAIINSIIKNGYIGNRSWDDNRRIEEIWAKGAAYADFLVKSSNKLIISQADLEKARSIVHNLRESGNTQYYINTPGETQKALYATIDDIPCKALPDKLIITDSLIQPIDFKVTSGSLQNWKYVARKFRQDIQASFYTRMLQEVYPFHTILPFIFTVASSYIDIKPYVYKCSEFDILTGSKGFSRIRHIKSQLHSISEEPVYGYEYAFEIYKKMKELNITDTFDVNGYYNNRTETLNLWL